MTEHEVQNALHGMLHLQRRWPIIPNCDVITGFEADMLALTKAGTVHEYEIKISRADLRADQRKAAKWASLRGHCVQVQRFGRPAWIHPDDTQLHPYRQRVCHPDRRPQHFWYVIHGFVVDLQEIPREAGVMIYDDRGRRFHVARQAPKLKTGKVDPVLINRAVNNMLYRYWNMRKRRVTNA